MSKIGIIGGGASGMMAAIAAAREGAEVTLFERKEKNGKKILATGNGRCNFSNRNLSSANYYCDDAEFVDDVFSRFGNNELCSFFNNLGMLVKDKNGYLYPACEQAASVVDIFEQTLKEEHVQCVTDAYVTKITKEDCFTITLDNGKNFQTDRVIIATGGRAGIGKEYANGYDLIKSLGHTYSRLYPALTQIKCKEFPFGAVSGVRSDCTISVLIDDIEVMKQTGEILFTDNGISGIVSFQISHCIAEAIDHKRSSVIALDFLPGSSEEDIRGFAASKFLLHDKQKVSDFFNGFLSKKLNAAIVKAAGLDSDAIITDYSIEDINKVVGLMKHLCISPTGVNSFDKAQVTGGGVLLSEVNKNLESLICPDAFITGELLNVDGICGGYNLQWAFSTGYIAGKAAALK